MKFNKLMSWVWGFNVLIGLFIYIIKGEYINILIPMVAYNIMIHYMSENKEKGK